MRSTTRVTSHESKIHILYSVKYSNASKLEAGKEVRREKREKGRGVPEDPSEIRFALGLHGASRRLKAEDGPSTSSG